MKISRTGSAANHGIKTVTLASPKFAWSTIDSSLSIRNGRAKDFSTSSHHSYALSVSMQELNEFLAALAKAALANPEVIEAGLAPSLKHLAQIHGVVAGIISPK